MVSASSSSSTASTTPRPAPTAMQSPLNASDVGVWSSAATVICVDPVICVDSVVCVDPVVCVDSVVVPPLLVSDGGCVVALVSVSVNVCLQVVGIAKILLLLQ